MNLSILIIASLSIAILASKSTNFIVIGDFGDLGDVGKSDADYLEPVTVAMDKTASSLNIDFMLTVGDNIY